MSPCMKCSDTSVGSQYPFIQGKRGVLAQNPKQHLANPISVLWVDLLEISFKGWMILLRCGSVDAIQLLGPGNSGSSGHPRKSTYMGNPLRIDQERLTSPQSLLFFFSRGDIQAASHGGNTVALRVLHRLNQAVIPCDR